MADVDEQVRCVQPQGQRRQEALAAGEVARLARAPA